MRILAAFLFFLCSYINASPIKGVLNVQFNIKFHCYLASDFQQFQGLAESVFNNANAVASTIVYDHLSVIEPIIPSDISIDQNQIFELTIDQDLNISFDDLNSISSVFFLGQMSANYFNLSIQFTIPILITPAQPGHPASISLINDLFEIPANTHMQTTNDLANQIESQYQLVQLPLCHIL